MSFLRNPNPVDPWGAGPRTDLVHGMRWFPDDADENRELPPWSWLVPGLDDRQVQP
jgi:hypothetical protein